MARAWTSLVCPSVTGEHNVQDARLVICLHGMGQSALEMAAWLQKDVVPLLDLSSPVVFAFLSAPLEDPEEGSSWLLYTMQADGEVEDDVCEQSLASTLRQVLDDIEKLCQHFQVAGCALLGYSQGGNIALACRALQDMCELEEDKANVSRIDVVLTLASHRLSVTPCDDDLTISCPWLALTARQDEVFPSSWAHATLGDAEHWKEVDDDHYLNESGPAIAELVNLMLRQY